MKAALENMLKAVSENLAKLEAEAAKGSDQAKAIRATRLMESSLQAKISAL